MAMSQPVAPPSPQLDAMMNPPEAEAPASRSSRRSFRARMSDTIQRARGRSASPARPEHQDVEAPASPSKGLRVSKLLRRSFDMARSTSPGPGTSRNQDVVYSYNAPPMEVPDLPDWQLYDGTSVSQDLDKMMAQKETLAPPPPAEPLPPLQPPHMAAHMHFQPGQVISTPAMQPMLPASEEVPPPAPAAPADEVPWSLPPGETPLFGQTRQRSRTARESLGTLPAASFHRRPSSPVPPAPTDDGRYESDIVDAYANEPPLPPVPADETADNTVIEHETMEPAAPSEAGSAWRTYDSDDEELDQGGAGRLYHQRHADSDGPGPSRAASLHSHSSEHSEAKQQRILSAMQKAPEGAGLTDLMNRVVNPERQSWFQGLWSRQSSRSSNASGKASQRSASTGDGVIFRGADASPSIYSNDERFSDRGSLLDPPDMDAAPAPSEPEPEPASVPTPRPSSRASHEPPAVQEVEEPAPSTGWEHHPDAQWHGQYAETWQDPNGTYYEGYDAQAAWYGTDGQWHDPNAQWRDPNAQWHDPNAQWHMAGQPLTVQSSHIADVSCHGAHEWEAPKQGWHHPNWRSAECDSDVYTRPHQVRRKAPPGSQPAPTPVSAPSPRPIPPPGPIPASTPIPSQGAAQIMPPIDEDDETIINEDGQRLKPDGFGGFTVIDDTPDEAPASPPAASPPVASPNAPPVASAGTSASPRRPRSELIVQRPRPSHVEPPRPRSSMPVATPPKAKDSPFHIAPEVYTTPQSLQSTRGRMTWTPEMAEAAAKYIQTMTASASQSLLHDAEPGTSMSAVPGAPEPLPPPKSAPAMPAASLPASQSVVEQLRNQGMQVVLEAGDGVELTHLPLQQALQEMMVRFYFFERHSVPLLRELDKRLIALEQWAELPADGPSEPPAWNREAVGRMTSEVRREVRMLMHGTKMLHESRLQVQELAQEASPSKKRKRPVSAVLPDKRHASVSTMASSRVCSGDSASSQATTVVRPLPEPPAALPRSPQPRSGPRPCPPTPTRTPRASRGPMDLEVQSEVESTVPEAATAEAASEAPAPEAEPETDAPEERAAPASEPTTLAPESEPTRAPSPPAVVPVQRARSVLLASLQRADERTRTPTPGPETMKESEESVPAKSEEPSRAPLSSVGNTPAPNGGGLRARAQKYLDRVEQSASPSGETPENVAPKRSNSFQPSALSESLRRRMAKFEQAGL